MVTDSPSAIARDVELDGREREDRTIGVHLVDERPGHGGDADRADGSRRDIEEIPPRRLYCCVLPRLFVPVRNQPRSARGGLSGGLRATSPPRPGRRGNRRFFWHCHKDLSSAQRRLSAASATLYPRRRLRGCPTACASTAATRSGNETARHEAGLRTESVARDLRAPVEADDAGVNHASATLPSCRRERRRRTGPVRSAEVGVAILADRSRSAR